MQNIRPILSSFREFSFSLLEITEKGEITQMPVSPKLPLGSDICTTVIGSWDSSVFLLHRRWYEDHAIDRVYLFNPVLGSCFKVTEEDYRVDTTSVCMEYKVGYIPSISTYKLFRFITYVTSNVTDSHKKDAAKALTIGLDKNWRNIDESLRLVLWKQGLCLINGAYHWLSEECGNRVCAIDLLEEKIGAGIPIPHGVSPRISLRILNRCLSVIDQADDDTMIIWSMKEYGVVESWSKDTVLTFRNPYPKHWHEPYFLPVAVFPNRNFLFTENFNDIFILRNKEKQLTQIEDPDPVQLSYCVNTYAPRFYALEEGTKIGG